MSKFEETYHEAIEHTKQKLLEDLTLYLGRNESLPDYGDYREDRKSYIEQIWINVWLNKAANSIPGKEKKEYLRNRGFATDGIDRKLINKLFRGEVKNHKPFDAFTWVDEMFADCQDGWEERYEKAREDYLKRQEELKLKQSREKIDNIIKSAAEDVIEQNIAHIYLRVRYHAAVRLKKDIGSNPKYRYIEPMMLEERLVEEGSFNQDDYHMLSDFFNELTGGIHSVLDWGRKSFEYESYYDKYEDIVFSFIYEVVPEMVLNRLPGDRKKLYEEAYGEELDVYLLTKMIERDLRDLADSCYEELQQEFLSDILRVSNVPFDEKTHYDLFIKDEQERERRLKEIAAEEERRKAEEERILNEIFAEEYAPSAGKSLRYILHVGETNTGKTFRALEKMKRAESGIYLAPLRLLALEVYEKLNADGVPCSLKTGEEEKPVPGAAHMSSTVEMFREKDHYEVIVIDEAQMIADEARGFSWYRAITKANASEVHIIGSRNMKDLMLELLEDEDVEVIEYTRDIPLQVEKKEFKLSHTKKGDALVCFSRRQVLETASRLQRNGYHVSMIYGSMPPETRQKQIQRFINGETQVVVATDAIGMGLNLPIRRIVFLENEKFDGTRRRRLTSQEVKQIAGRAGRKGIYEVGRVAFTSDIPMMEELLSKDDRPVLTFAIAPTSGIFERFQRYYRDLGAFFELWDKFEPPAGTKKASLSEEKELYEYIRGTEIEARIPMRELYGFLHIPFDAKESILVQQWLDTMHSIVFEYEIPEPVIRKRTLEDLERSYKSIGLHLLFLYRLDRRTEAVYWERIRSGLTEDVHEHLKNEVKNYQKKCKRCGKKLSDEAKFPICDSCYEGRFKNKHRYGGKRR
ncbi:helicase-related protein [Mesobacillus zeae]|uniref:RNA helicase n=1 Tax=Mesobacillus zeae TaxID=1917180 RepID=A0A398BD96_9BACI|nr:helicase-related protein [Mesobacillus zeae]RID85626.1 RNA helicase [Mesobacillus zeae]